MRPTSRTDAQAGHSDPVIYYGIVIAQRIKVINLISLCYKVLIT